MSTESHDYARKLLDLIKARQYPEHLISKKRAAQVGFKPMTCSLYTRQLGGIQTHDMLPIHKAAQLAGPNENNTRLTSPV